jgi:pyruvate dehydrogenase (quinone)
MQFAEAVKAPIVHALGGKDHVEWENPYDVCMTGLIGFSSGYYAMESCDALLMLGTDFPYRPFYPTEARIAQVDIRPQAIGRRAPADIGVVGQVGPTLRALMPRIKVKSERRHLDKARTPLLQRPQEPRRGRGWPTGRAAAPAAHRARHQ